MYKENHHDWLDERDIERDQPTLDEVVIDHAAAFDFVMAPVVPADAQDIPF